jgi:hypothetical protein
LSGEPLRGWPALDLLIQLISQLFELARTEAQKQKRAVSYTKRPVVSTLERHVRVYQCCSLAVQVREPSQKRKALDELSTNQNAPKMVRLSVYSCKAVWRLNVQRGPLAGRRISTSFLITSYSHVNILILLVRNPPTLKSASKYILTEEEKHVFREFV